MGHVRLDKVPGRQGRAERELASQYAGRDDTRELLGVFAGRGGVGAADAEEVEHGGLGFEDGAAADGADFDCRAWRRLIWRLPL